MISPKISPNPIRFDWTGAVSPTLARCAGEAAYHTARCALAGRTGAHVAVQLHWVSRQPVRRRPPAARARCTLTARAGGRGSAPNSSSGAAAGQDDGGGTARAVLPALGVFTSSSDLQPQNAYKGCLIGHVQFGMNSNIPDLSLLSIPSSGHETTSKIGKSNETTEC